MYHVIRVGVRVGKYVKGEVVKSGLKSKVRRRVYVNRQGERVKISTRMRGVLWHHKPRAKEWRDYIVY